MHGQNFFLRTLQDSDSMGVQPSRYEQQIFPLRDFANPNNAEALFALCEREDQKSDAKDAGPKAGCKATVEFLQALYKGQWANNPASWTQCRDQVHVSTIRETEYGGTSVSDGVFTRVLRGSQPMNIFNNGSNGVRGRRFCRNPKTNILERSDEYEMPGKQPAPSFHRIASGPYNPQQAESLHIHAQRLRDLSSHMGPGDEIGFITGDARQVYYHRATLAERAVMDRDAKSFFGRANPPPGCASHFISQADEAGFEFLGCHGMHDKLAKMGEINARYDVVAAIGIGGRTTQLGVDEKGTCVAVDRGMNKPQELASLSTDLLRGLEYGPGPAGKIFQDSCAKVVEPGGLPLLCLKAGAGLRLGPRHQELAAIFKGSKKL
jgi:hypothetical protein